MAEQWASVTVRAGTAGVSASGVGDAPIGEAAEENVETAGSMVSEDKAWEWEGIMTAEVVEKIGLCGQTRELLFQCRDVQTRFRRKLLRFLC